MEKEEREGLKEGRREGEAIKTERGNCNCTQRAPPASLCRVVEDLAEGGDRVSKRTKGRLRWLALQKGWRKAGESPDTRA